MSDEELVDVHTWFSLTYANYLVWPRAVMQSMPLDWQHRFTALAEEVWDLYGHLEWPEYAVNVRTESGRFGRDPMPHYNRGRTYIEPKRREVS